MKMLNRRPLFVWLGLMSTTGLSLGFVLSRIHDFDLMWAAGESWNFDRLVPVWFLFLACVGEWLEVRFGPLGGVTLRPLVAFVALWSNGPTLFILTGLLPILIVGRLAKRTPSHEVLSVTGRDALCFWVALLTYQGALGVQDWLWGAAAASAVAVKAASFLSFWAVQIPLQAVDLNFTEGIRFGAAFQHIVRHAWMHTLTLALSAMALSYVEANFGVIVMGFAVAMVVEAYYPWKLLGEQGEVLLTSLQMMAQAVDLKDPYTSNHSQRVSQYAVRLARAMGLAEDEVERIRIGALMHDIGKIGISGRIIRKAGKLSEDEQKKMREHSEVSANIIGPLEILGESAEMVRHHHENWDGTGYPDGLKGEEIPLGSRIIFVADALDAIVTDRPYRKGASRVEALAIIKEKAGTQFDPAVVKALERVFNLL